MKKMYALEINRGTAFQSEIPQTFTWHHGKVWSGFCFQEIMQPIVFVDAASNDPSPFANFCTVVLLHVIFAVFFSHARSYASRRWGGLITFCRLFSWQLL